MSGFPARGIERITHLPPLKVSKRYFESLPDYSGSVPTGVTHGKRWKRLDGAHDQRLIQIGKRGRKMMAWMIGEYQVIEYFPDDTMTYKTVWYRPVIRVRGA